MNLLHIGAPLATLCITSLTTIGGVGGAFVLVPIFYSLGLPMYEAETLGLSMAFFSASTASINYHFGGHIKYRMAAALIASMLLLSPLGSYVSVIANRNLVFVVFFILLMAGGAIMRFYRRGDAPQDDSAKITKRDYALGVLTGGLIGFLSGLLGIGGGILIGPFLVLRGFAAKDVSGTSSFFVVCSAVTGFLGHLDFMRYAHVHLDYPLFASVVAGRSSAEFSARTLRGSN